jgi:hypothetical protein
MACTISKTQQGTGLLPLMIPARRPAGPPASLIEAIQFAVLTLGEAGWQPTAADPAGTVLPPRILLVLLAFYLARGVYPSSEICGRLAHDESLRQICPRWLPDAGELAAFRRRHRAEIEHCLRAALRFLAAQPDGIPGQDDETVIADEARRRVILASCLDGMDVREEGRPGRIPFHRQYSTTRPDQI